MLIQLLELLKSGEPYTVQELAELTGTDAASVKAEIEYLEHTGYIKPGSIKKEETKKALERAKGFLRRELSHKFNIYKTPELRFIYDQSDEYGKHIDELIEKVNEQK